MTVTDNSLLVDLGNTSLKWGWVKQGQLSQVENSAHKGQGLATLLDKHWSHLPPPESVRVVAVADAALCDEFQRWVARHWQKATQFMGTGRRAAGVVCGYRDPARLGVDRWAAIIAAHRHYPDGVCVVDCGTAITLDVVGRKGRHLGGYIIPGFSLMQDSLVRGTAIADCTEVPSGEEWGDDTSTAISLGSRKAVAALVEQSVERLQAAGVCDPGLLLTGGDRGEVSALIELAHDLNENLVLEGLLAWAQEIT